MRKALLTIALVAAVVVAIVLISGGGSNGYLVRAFFDNGAFMVQGEQVRVAGANVGHDPVGRSLDAGRTRSPIAMARRSSMPAKAVIVMEISDPGFPGLPLGRQLPDPPAVADRREVRRLQSDSAAGAGFRSRRRR